MTAKELQDEKMEAKLWGRPERSFIFDKPGPYYGIPPEPLVNFNLNFK